MTVGTVISLCKTQGGCCILLVPLAEAVQVTALDVYHACMLSASSIQ